MNKFKCYGVLWNSSYTFANDFFKDIDSTYSIENLYFLDIKNFTYEFVKQIYPELLPDEYAKYKANMLANHRCVKIIVFSFSVENPKYVYNPEELQEYCVQVKQLKTRLREKYIPLIQDYEHDILSHFADNEKESRLIKDALENNKSRILKIFGFKHPQKDTSQER